MIVPLDPCFGHARAEPDDCPHPSEAHFCHAFDAPVLMLGRRPARPDEQPPAGLAWEPVGDRRPSAGYWYTMAAQHEIQCMACGAVIGGGTWQLHLEELPPEVLAARWRITLEDARRCHRPPPKARK